LAQARLAGLIAAALAVVAAAGAAPPPVPAFERVVVIVFENKESGQVLGNPAAPAFNALARRYATISRYTGVAHPSLPNYLALVSGSTHGIAVDCTRCAISARNLADTLEAAGRTWRTYAEGYPASPRYAKKHNPFLYFTDVASRPQRLARIVPLSLFDPKRLPDFSLVVPDLCHDMHDCSVSTGDAWLARFVPPLLGKGVVFVIFDEGATSEGGGGHVAALALGAAVRPHSTFVAPTSHYGLLRTIEDAWGLKRLGETKKTPAITGIWR